MKIILAMPPKRVRKIKDMVGVTSFAAITGSKLPSRGQVVGRMYYRISEENETISVAARYNIKIFLTTSILFFIIQAGFGQMCQLCFVINLTSPNRLTTI